MILTSSQIEEVLRIIDRYQAVFISHNIGTSVLSDYDKSILKSAGIDLSKIKTIGGVEEAFRFGMLSNALGNRSKLMTYPAFKEYLQSGAMPLNSFESQVLESLKRQTYNDVTKQFERVKGDIKEQLVFADKKLNAVLHSKRVTDVGKIAVETRGSVSWMASELGHLTGKWDRDLGRISHYVLHQSFDEGRAAESEKKNGSKALVYKNPYSGACKNCIRVYLKFGIGSEPIVFELDNLKANGTNIGKKVKDWKAVVGAIHPNCRCLLMDVPYGMTIANLNAGLWEWNGMDFKRVESSSSKVKRTRPKVKVTVNEKTKYV